MQIQVNFTKPELVSKRTTVDKIRVTFWGTEFFKSKMGIEVLYGTTIEAEIIR